MLPKLQVELITLINANISTKKKKKKGKTANNIHLAFGWKNICTEVRNII